MEADVINNLVCSKSDLAALSLALSVALPNFGGNASQDKKPVGNCMIHMPSGQKEHVSGNYRCKVPITVPMRHSKKADRVHR